MQFAGIHLLLQVGEHLVFVAQLVYQAVLERVVGQKRSLIDQRAHGVRGFLAGLRDPADQVAVEIVHHGGHHLAGFRTHGRAREHVAEVLVLAIVLHLHTHADLIQRVLEVHEFDPHALQVEPIRGAEIDAVGGGRQVILARAGGLQKGEQGLAGFLEPLQIGAEFFELAPAHAERFRLQHHRFDARIHGGLRSIIQTLVTVGAGRSAKRAERDFHRRTFGYAARELELQHRVLRDGGRAFAEGSRQREEDQKHGRRRTGPRR
jgi:hypothetical protein